MSVISGVSRTRREYSLRDNVLFRNYGILVRGIVFVLILCIPFISCSQSTYLYRDGKSEYKIVAHTNVEEINSIAHNLREDLKKVGLVHLEISNDFNASGRKIVLSVSDSVHLAHAYIMTRLTGDVEFVIQEIDGDLFIVSNTVEGLSHAVSEFSSKYLKVDKLTPNKEAHSYIGKLDIKNISYLGKPHFSHRLIYTSEAEDPAYRSFHKLQAFQGKDNHLWGGAWGHTFFRFVPPSNFYKTYPEFYSLINGKRIPEQLCLSNESVVHQVKTALSVMIERDPSSKYWFVGQEDNDSHCECDRCSKIDNDNGSKAGSLLNFVNQIALAFPEKTIVTLAYGETQKAPRRIRPVDNVMIMFCTSGDFNRVTPLEQQNINIILDPWLQKTSNIMIWDYISNFKHTLFPLQNLTAIGENIKFFAKKGVKGFFVQGNIYGGGAFDEIKSYVVAKLLWDPTLDTDTLIKDFVQGYYGIDADAAIKLLYDTGLDLQHNYNKIGLFDDPTMLTTNFFKLRNFNDYVLKIGLKNNGKNFIDGSHVASLLAPYQFVQTSQYLAALTKNFHSFDPAEYKIVRNAATSLVNTLNSNGSKFMGENGVFKSDFVNGLKFVFDDKPSILVEENKAYRKPFTIVHKSSSIHAGDNGLLDGISANLNLENNSWVVFQDGLLDVTIDLQSKVAIHTVSINFMEADIVKMYYPSDIEVFVSQDGRRYHKWNTYNIRPLHKTHDAESSTYTFTNKDIKGRYVRVVARSRKLLGLDEIIIK